MALEPDGGGGVLECKGGIQDKHNVEYEAQLKLASEAAGERESRKTGETDKPCQRIGEQECGFGCGPRPKEPAGEAIEVKEPGVGGAVTLKE